MKLYKNIDELIGHTLLLELVSIEKECELAAKIIAKVEYFNPGGSIMRLSLWLKEKKTKVKISLRFFLIPEKDISQPPYLMNKKEDPYGSFKLLFL